MGPAWAQSPVAQTTVATTPTVKSHTVTLAEAVDLAKRNNLDLISTLTKIDQAEARKEQASAIAMPKIIATALGVPIYSETGNALQTQSNMSKWGPWLQSTTTVLLPLYTWGKIASLKEAAGQAFKLAQAEVRKSQDQLGYEAKELYYGAVLVEQIYNFVDEGRKDIQQILEKAEVDQKKKKPQIKKRDFYRLKVFSAEADFQFQEAEKLKNLARHALSLKLGFDPDDETLPQDTQLNVIDAALPTESELIQKMLQLRPELEQLRSGIAAKKALLDSEKTNKYPMFFFGGQVSFAYSNMRDKQAAAYAFDPYNRSQGGVGVGLQWNFDFASAFANEHLLRAEIDELEKKQDYARVGFRMELKKSLADLQEAKARLASSQEAFQIGKRWLVSETMGYSLGVTEVKDLIDAYLARAKTVKDHWESIFKVNMAWAALSKTVGSEITPSLGSP